MYTIYDYAYNGYLYLNNIMRPHHKRLSQLMIYSTTACQSRCKHCNIWQKKVEHLSLEDIKRIMQSRCVTKRTTVGLEGGEFILHPLTAEIMAWFREHHPNYTLLSNCLAPRRVIDAVRLYQPRRLYVSLDGGRETYQRMRGRDGYDRVIQVVEALKDEVPLSLMFCLSPWNDFDDMAYVIDVAKHYDVDIRIGIYGTMAFFDTTSELLTASDFISQIPASIHQTQENFDFVALYDQWRNGHLRLPCQGAYPEGSALLDLYIHPLDLVTYLFGPPEIIVCQQIAPASYILMLRHPHIVGTLELSTAYTWTNAEESLKVCTSSGVYRLSQMEELNFESKPSTIFGIPCEKVCSCNRIIEHIYSRNNFTPTLPNNQIYFQGYFNEIQAFLDVVECRQKKDIMDMQSLRTVYETIAKI